MFRGKSPETWPYKIEGVGQDEMPGNVDFSIVDEIHTISDKESFNVTRSLARMEGIFAGSSSGFAIAGAMRTARKGKKSDYIVVLLPDSGSRYLSKVFNDAWMKENQYLDPPVKLNTTQILTEKGKKGQLISVSSDATIREAIALMRKHGISQLPVIADGDILGGLDETHLLKLLLNNSEAWHHNVLEFMDAPFPLVEEDASVDELVAILGQDAQAILVRQKGGGLSIITKSDLIFTLLNAEKEVAPYNS